MKNRKGQTAMEISVLLCVVMASLVAIQGLLRSSIMGNWFSSAQQLADPYNPPGTTGTITHTTTSNTTTFVKTIQNDNSSYSLRIDSGNSTENKAGTLTVKP